MECKKQYVAAGLMLGCAMIVQGGCAAPAKNMQSAPPAVSVPKPADNGLASGDTPKLSGKVLETMNASGYTYILLEKDSKKFWVAVPGAQVAVGQDVEVRPGTEMGKFSSKTLGKAFDNIIFSTGLVTQDGAAPAAASGVQEPKGAPAVALPQGHPSLEGAVQKPENNKQPGPAVTPISGKIVETMDAGGYTYICLENSGKKIWAAVPATKVTVGQEINILPGAEMLNFNSPSLNRSFDSVIFSGGVIPPEQ